MGQKKFSFSLLYFIFFPQLKELVFLVAGHFTLHSISLVTRITLWSIENKSLSLGPCSLPLI